MISRLLEKDAVYRCFCTPKRLDLLRREAAKNRETIKYDNRCRHLSKAEVQENLSAEKPFTVRLWLKEGPTTVSDLVYGPVTYDLSRIEGDPVLVKSDGLPTYHFANVVDDHTMAISHVLRGVEWLVSTPKHLMLYEAFGWKPPAYAHLPLIVNRDGSKLSKRHEHIRIETYRSAGYYPSTVTSYLTQMGGGFGSLEEGRIHSLEELSKVFRLASVNVNNCRIDEEKIRLLNREALRGKFETGNGSVLVKELQDLLLTQTEEGHLKMESIKDVLEDTAYLHKVLSWALEGGRVVSLKELSTSEEYRFLWCSPFPPTWTPMDSLAISPKVAKDCLQGTVDLLRNSISEEDFNSKELLTKLREVHAKVGEAIKFATFMRLLRFGLTNLKAGAPVAETMQLLGRARSTTYLELALKYVRQLEEEIR